jgi:hypothetical protein
MEANLRTDGAQRAPIESVMSSIQLVAPDFARPRAAEHPQASGRPTSEVASAPSQGIRCTSRDSGAPDALSPRACRILACLRVRSRGDWHGCAQGASTSADPPQRDVRPGRALLRRSVGFRRHLLLFFSGPAHFQGPPALAIRDGGLLALRDSRLGDVRARGNRLCSPQRPQWWDQARSSYQRVGS